MQKQLYAQHQVTGGANSRWLHVLLWHSVVNSLLCAH
jgi:hypothetical protein